MKRLKTVITQYGRWAGLADCANRIETYAVSDFSLAVDNSKSLLDTIAKEICSAKGVDLGGYPSTNAALKKAFSAIGHTGSDLVTQISSSLANIGKHVSQLRDEIGTVSHGKTLEELKTLNDRVDQLTKEFLIDSVVVVACFLIRSFEVGNPRAQQPTPLIYSENYEFNDYWDDLYGEFAMGDYSYSASEILYGVDNKAYESESEGFKETMESVND